MSLFAFVIIHQGHEQKEINLCLAAFIDPDGPVLIMAKIPRFYLKQGSTLVNNC